MFKYFVYGNAIREPKLHPWILMSTILISFNGLSPLDCSNLQLSSLAASSTLLRWPFEFDKWMFSTTWSIVSQRNTFFFSTSLLFYSLNDYTYYDCMVALSFLFVLFTCYISSRLSKIRVAILFIWKTRQLGLSWYWSTRDLFNQEKYCTK